MATSLPSLPTLPTISPYVENSQSSYSMNLTPEEISDANLASNNYLGTSLPTSTAETSQSVSTSSPLQASGSTSVSTAATLAGSISNAAKNILSFKSITLEDWIFIVLGLLLIAAGVFAFKQTQTIIEKATDVGTRVAEVSAKAAA